MTAQTPGQAARDEDDREALATDAEDIDGALAAELRELADWYESSARYSKGIRANEQQLCANRIRAALVRAVSGHAAAQKPQPAPARADEFARMKVKLSALIASMEDTVRPRPDDMYDPMSREFDDGAVHATAVNLRQLRAILDETATAAGEPQPAPGLAALTRIRELTSGILTLAEHLEESAAATAPSKKSAIERETAATLRRLLDVSDDHQEGQ